MVVQDGALRGSTTDGLGVTAPLKKLIDLKGKSVVILGAGGAARAAALALRGKGARVTILARDEAKAAAVGRSVGCAHAPLAELSSRAWDVLVNATPVGSASAPEETPVPAELHRKGSIVFDMVYDPLETRLLREAKAAGCAIVGGLEMLLAQAVAQFETWTGLEAPGAGHEVGGPAPRPGGTVSRYSRQELFAGIGPDGQERIRASRVVVVGLRRPRLRPRRDDGPRRRRRAHGRRPRLRRGVEPAAAVALRPGGRGARASPRPWPPRRSCAASTPTSPSRGIVADLSAENVDELIRDVDLVLDGTDNFETRFLVNDVCVRDGNPLGLRRLRRLLRPGPPGPAPRLALPPLRPGGDASARLGAHVRHGRCRRAHRPRDRRPPGRRGPQGPGRPHRGPAARSRDRGPLAGDLRGDGPPRRAPSCPACTEGRYDYLAPGRRQRRPCSAAATRCSSAAAGGSPSTFRPSPAACAAVGDVSANEYLVRFSSRGRRSRRLRRRPRHRQGRDATRPRPASSTPGTWGADDERHVPSARPGPARRAVLRRRRGAPPPRSSSAAWSRSSRAGTTRRSSRPSTTTPTCSPARPSQAKTYSFVGRDGSLLALRPDFTSLLAKIAAGRLAGPSGADPPLLLGRGASLRAAARPAGRASSTRWASSTWAARPGRPTPRCWPSPPSAWSAVGASGCVLALGHVGVFAGLVAGCGLDAGALEMLRERVEAKDADGRARRPGGERRRRPPRADALAPLTALAGGPRRARRGRARPGRASPPARGAARGARGSWPGLSRRGPRRSRGHRPRRGARASTTTRASSSAPTRPASASRWAAAAATTPSSGASAGPCPPWASCSASIALALLLERQGALPGVSARRRRSPWSGADVGRRSGEARRRRAAGARVRRGRTRGGRR